MESTLGWIDLSAAALRRLRQDLEDKPEGVVDEMGVLAIHSGYADQFFPGTSVLQKRPRYAFFTCWNYLCLDRLSGDFPSARARKETAEEWLTKQLKASHQPGIIGARVERPAQPVDFVYWTALRKWGFYRGPDRNKLLSKWNSINVRRVRALEDSDEDAGDDPSAAFLVPAPPHYWLRPRPRDQVTFDLTKEEADFLQKRLESLPGCLLASAAARAAHLRAKARSLWHDPLIIEAANDRRESEMVERARRASSLGYLIRATYGALVERRRNETASKARLSQIANRLHYREILLGLFDGDEDVFRDIRGLDLDLLTKDVPALTSRFVSLLRYTKERADRVKHRADVVGQLLDDATLDLFSKEEQCRKQNRARLPDNQFGADRRDAFDESTVRAFPIDYRWNVVRPLLRDLHDGLRLQT